MAANTNAQNELDARCSYECLMFINHIINSTDTIVVLDSPGEIFREYRNNLRAGGQNTIATIFLIGFVGILPPGKID